MNRLTIASIQPPVFSEKSTENNDRIIELGFRYLEESLDAGATLCCLPEFFNVFGVAEENMQDVFENADLLIRRATALAQQYRAYIVLPMLIRDTDKFLNRAYLIGPNDEQPAFYDKTHPTLGEKEQLGVEPGDRIPIFETELGRLAIMICYDIYFPELFAALTLKKPDIIFFPSLQRSDHEMASEAQLKTRAMDSKAYIVRSSFGCPNGTPWKAGMMFGQSCIVHPDGTILANAGHYEGIALARTPFPFHWQRQRCGGYPAMNVRDFLEEDRRPDLYRSLGE